MQTVVPSGCADHGRTRMTGTEAEVGPRPIIENGDTTIRGKMKMEDIFEGYPKLSSLDSSHQPELGQIDARMKESAICSRDSLLLNVCLCFLFIPRWHHGHGMAVASFSSFLCHTLFITLPMQILGQSCIHEPLEGRLDASHIGVLA